VDEIHWGHGLRADNFLTVIYQIDVHCRRLLWVGRRRSQATMVLGNSLYARWATGPPDFTIDHTPREMS
jgi:hypothetical protein